jgi:hypothetical protein
VGKESTAASHRTRTEALLGFGSGRIPFLIGAQADMGRSPDKKACFNNAYRKESLCQLSDTAKEKSPFPKLGATVSAMESSPNSLRDREDEGGAQYGTF